MKVLRLLFYLPVFAAANAMPAFAAPRPSEIVPLYVSATRPFAMLTIGDSAPMPVVFDTGTDENILDAALATRAGLKVVGQFNLAGPLICLDVNKQKKCRPKRRHDSG